MAFNAVLSADNNRTLLNEERLAVIQFIQPNPTSKLTPTNLILHKFS